ncbi:YdcF family protein [Hydrogenimonas sp.]
MIYPVSKLFTAFFLPPGLFIVFLAGAALFVRRWRFLFLSFAALFYFLSLEPVADTLLEPFEAPWRHNALPDEVDAVVMLGGGAVRGSPVFPLRNAAFKRGVYALTLARSYDRPLVVSGAGSPGYAEGDAFLDSLRTMAPILAFSPEVLDTYEKRFSILLERKSLDTYQNISFVKKLLPPDSKILVVTSAYHMKRAMRLCDHIGLDAEAAATDFHVSKEPYDLYDLLPKIDALHNSYRALHETFGLVKVFMRELAENFRHE